jgi:plastocyanin
MSTQAVTTKRAISTTIVAIIIVVLVAGLAGGYYVFYYKGSASAACSSSASSPSTSSVNIPAGTGSNNSLNFVPKVLTVKLGTNNTITFTNNDNTMHTVIFTSGPCSPIGSIGDTNLPAGATYTVTLAAPGTYQYYCNIHNWMSGTIVVKAGSSSGSPSSGY